jgi:hypothetical protein
LSRSMSRATARGMAWRRDFLRNHSPTILSGAARTRRSRPCSRKSNRKCAAAAIGSFPSACGAAARSRAPPSLRPEKLPAG